MSTDERRAVGVTAALAVLVIFVLAMSGGNPPLGGGVQPASAGSGQGSQQTSNQGSTVPSSLVGLDQAKAKIDFPLSQPGWLPPGFQFKGVQVISPQHVALFWTNPGQNGTVKLEEGVRLRGTSGESASVGGVNGWLGTYGTTYQFAWGNHFVLTTQNVPRPQLDPIVANVPGWQGN